MTNYDTAAYMERVWREIEAGHLVVTASICRQCSGVIPRIDEQRITSFLERARMCQCGELVTRDIDHRAHGMEQIRYQARPYIRMD